MASTIDFSLIREPQLLDLIDDEWARDRLPDDGKPGQLGSVCVGRISGKSLAHPPLTARASAVPPADVPLPANAQLLADVEEESKAKEPERWLELGLQSVG